MRMPSPNKIRPTPIHIPGNVGFAKITNIRAPIKTGILRTFFCQAALLSCMVSSLPTLSNFFLNIIADGAVLHPSHSQQVNEGSYQAVSNIVFGLPKLPRMMENRNFDDPITCHLNQ